MSMFKKLLWLDTETTGTDPRRHSVMQFAALLEEGGRVVDSIDVKFAPLPGAAVEESALEVTGVTREELEARPPAQDAYFQIVGFLDRHCDKYNREEKFYPAGYNVRFDLDFMQEFFRACGSRYGIGSYTNWRYIDPLPVLYRMDYMGALDLKDYKLGTVCEHYGIPLEAHDALNDVRAARELARKLDMFL